MQLLVHHKDYFKKCLFLNSVGERQKKTKQQQQQQKKTDVLPDPKQFHSHLKLWRMMRIWELDCTSEGPFSSLQAPG